ncbi:DNA N-6-adenine-methyltransferase [Teichococcus vastitatis]|uniref:DNA N-6-adenine-methyltransferase n=1 Tax=Teichococcus vastitatis TaxID=2307076 RepID=UPI000E772C32
MHQNRLHVSALGLALATLRRGANLSQVEVAERAKCARTTVISAEAGRGAASAYLALATELEHEISGRSLPPGATLSERLAALRARQGTSRRDLARQADVSPTTLATMEGGSLGHLAAVERVGIALGAGLRLVPRGASPGFWTNAAASSAYEAWTTPPDLLARIYPLLPEGRFCLDPCSPTADKRRAPVRAMLHYTAEDDGLSLPWRGRTVWLNPPYGRSTGSWTAKARIEVSTGNVGAVFGLFPARTDTRWWTDVAGHADVLMLRGRLKFGNSTAPAPFPSALSIWGGDDALRLGLQRAFSEAWYINRPAG